MFLFRLQPSIANATNIDTLLAGTEGKEEIAVPPESVQDKVFFIFNNLSLSNMEQKVTSFSLIHNDVNDDDGDDYGDSDNKSNLLVIRFLAFSSC